jgi:hypothetical protein
MLALNALLSIAETDGFAVPQYESLYEKDNVSTPDLSTVVTKVPIISGQAVRSLT